MGCLYLCCIECLFGLKLVMNLSFYYGFACFQVMICVSIDLEYLFMLNQVLFSFLWFLEITVCKSTNFNWVLYLCCSECLYELKLVVNLQILLSFCVFLDNDLYIYKSQHLFVHVELGVVPCLMVWENQGLQKYQLELGVISLLQLMLV